jgi:pseudouridine-5'-phosphate glycosidase
MGAASQTGVRSTPDAPGRHPANGRAYEATGRRYAPSNLTAVEHLIRLSEEVESALDEERAVVALETTLVAHGFPVPDGIEVARASEAAARAAGAVPATIGVLDGRLVIGLTEAELERFTPDARKLGPRDLAACAVQGAVGATTVGGTLAAAQAIGIRFMGTGGLGGVHRGFPRPPDVSADLGACARIPAVIVSSGVKSLLDVGATAEVLETLGVPVLGYRVDTLPLFYAANGGPSVSARVEDAAEVARIADAHWRLGGNAILVGRPPDESLDVAGLIEEIVGEAHDRGIVGQAVTPFVLAALHERSSGETLRVNRDLIVANAGLAAEIAVAFVAL